MNAIDQVLARAKATKGSNQREEIVKVYNSYTPRARGYKVKVTDELCATFVSSLFIYYKWTDIVPPECGAHQLYDNMAKLGRGVLDPKRVPNRGDLIFFGKGGSWKNICHVGIVDEVVNNKQIYYYDIQASVKRRTCPITFGGIMGYGMPDYASKDNGIPQVVETPAASNSEFKAGDLVRIKPGALWYNGATIKSGIYLQNWYILQVKGDRAVLNQNENKTSHIMSPIHTSDIVLVTESSTPSAPAASKVSITIEVSSDVSDKLYAKAKAAGLSLSDWISNLV